MVGLCTAVTDINPA